MLAILADLRQKSEENNVHLIKQKMTKIAMFIAIVALCIGTLLVILFGVKQFKIGSQLSGENQAANIAHLLVRQQANLFSMLLVNKAGSEKLVDNLDNLVKEEFVLNAAIYAANGQLLAQSSNAISVVGSQLKKLTQEDESAVQQIVEPIYSSNGIEGFLRVGFDAKYGQTTQHKIEKMFHRLYGELIIVFLLGLLLASSTHYFINHYRRAHRKIIELPQLKSAKLTNSLNFHRRRRRAGK